MESPPVIRIDKPDHHLVADIALDGSKSLSNRALVALALAGARPTDWLSNLSTSRDTAVLLRLLEQRDAAVYDAGDAGTTFRFLTACLALQPGEQVLTGSARMRRRPVGALVEALRQLGADIEYLETTGFPPLRIGPPRQLGQGVHTLGVRADVSSQFLSALLLIAPYLPQGIEIQPEGRLVSRPYIDMTLRLMRHFGAQADWQGERLVVAPGAYVPRPLAIEADWSAASYWYAMAALAEEADLHLRGLHADSWQGDAAVADMLEAFGVRTRFETDGVHLSRLKCDLPALFVQNFSHTPDIAQTLAVLCGALGVPGRFSGLETLAIKETDRTAALQTELNKIGVIFTLSDPARDIYSVQGHAAWSLPPRFATYDDHRMAMAFAPLAMLGPIDIERPDVVEKSYPAFWSDLQKAGFHLREIK